jgi:tetratricopeptide (TPR) repeat protein
VNTKPESWYRADWLGALFLVAATLAAYLPAWHAGFIWDDDAHVTRPVLQGLHGLARIWDDPGATQQYYPVLYSAFWLEHRAWGDASAGYHIANILLHALAACLLFRALRLLAVPGAFLAAAVFALHPVNVESVAWISEQKNTLSAVFYLAAGLAYLRFDEGRRPAWYGMGAGLFVLALLSKSVTATLPAALLVILWWKRGRLSFKRDVLPVAPWLGLGAACGAVTAWMERTHVGANGAAFALSAGARVAVAGRALWFYLGKILWPARLAFIYPRWDMSAPGVLAFVYPLAALAALACLWALRGRARGPVATALLFAGTLFPALGFVNVFPFLYSFVADHFQYLALAMMVSGLAGGAALAAARLSPALRRAAAAAAAAIVAVLAFLTWRQCATYADPESLWRATLARNPACWMADNNLASELLKDGRVDEAIAAVHEGIRLEPSNAAAQATLGEALGRKGRIPEAIDAFERALAIEPSNAAARIDLGADLLQAGRLDEAIAQYTAALAIIPDSATAHGGLADAYLRSGRLDEAIAEYGRSLEDDPRGASVHANLATALVERGRRDEAIAHYRKAVEIDPAFTAAWFNLGNALFQVGRFEDSAASYGNALQLDPGFAAAHADRGLALLRSGNVREAVAELEQALRLDPANEAAEQNLEEARSQLLSSH